MPIRTLQEQLDTLYTTTWQLRRDAIADVVFTSNPLFMKLDQQGNREEQQGGRRIEQPLRYGKNESVQFVGRGDTVQVQETDNLSVAYFDWKYLTGHVVRRFQDFQRNRGKAQFKKKAKQDINTLQDSLESKTELVMFEDGTRDNGKAFDGLQLLVADDPTTGTMGGIDRSTYDWWRNYYYDMSGEEVSTYLLTRMRHEFNNCGNYGHLKQRFPDLLMTTQTIYEAYEAEAAALGQIVKRPDPQVADLGFGDLAFKGQALTWSMECPDYHLYELNTAAISWTIDPIEYMELGKWRPLQLTPRDRIAHSMTVGNLTVANARKNSVIFNIGN